MRYLFLIFFSISASALELPYLVNDNMVVQRGEEIPFWGWAKPNESIVVTFNENVLSTIASSSGEWQVKFPSMKAGGPYSLQINGQNNNYAFDNILVGDVWLCSGQSNMEWPLEETEHAKQAIASANDKLIRHFKVPKSWASSPQNKLAGGSWEKTSPDTVGEFSAVGYYFAQHLRKEIDIPIGLLNASWGGSNIESWMNTSALDISAEENLKILKTIELEEIEQAKKVEQRLAKWPGALSDDYKSAKADWSKKKLDENGWITVTAPLLWEKGKFNGLNGVAWYRKHFSLSAAQASKDLELLLAKIDDHDITWINGHKVGETKVYNAARSYKIDKQILVEGNNTIAIRVLDTGGGGGIWGEPEEMLLKGPGVNLSLAGDWLFKVDKGSLLVGSERNHTQTALYNKMLHPLGRVPVKGVLWYQGEANASKVEDALAYKDQFKNFIQSLRKLWKNENLPFYWVQLANFNSTADTKKDSPWAELRESQTLAQQLPHTGQAVIIDVGDPDDIHPRDKNTVGKRLALHALKNEYGKKTSSAKSPELLSASIEKNTVIISMSNASNLQIASGNTLFGFELADKNGVWHQASASIDLDKITVRSDSVSQPVSVRYAWSDNPEKANLKDASGLPATPFRKLDL